MRGRKEHTTEQVMRIEVIKALKNHKALRVRMKNIQEQHESGYETLFTKVKEDPEHELRFKQIERTLHDALDEDQRRIIELKYLGSESVKDPYVYNELMMQRDPYYEKKGSAIVLIATALGII